VAALWGGIVKTFGLAAFLVLGMAQPVFAQSFPSQNMRIIVPFGPGGSPDVLGRLVAAKLSEKYGRSVVIENKPGANGLIGAEMAKNARPDGHTLFVGNTGILAINRSLYARLPYDPIKDFAPITQMISLPFFLYAHTQLGVSSVKDLIALLKTKPGVLNYASSGNGSVHHMCTALFLNLVGADAVHVPYKMSFDIAKALMGDQVQLACSGKLAAQQIVDAGKAKPIAVALEQRTSLDPQIPTLKEETGIDGFEVGSRIGILAPAGTPPEIVDQLSKDVASFIQTDQIRSVLAVQGVEIVTEGPERYAALIRREIEQYAKLVKLTGAKIEN
jgi:tripartite-type tricarboxylate transporter receptor subunit TctC